MSIYMDNAATTPLMRQAAQAMKQYYESDFFNPAAGYSQSKAVREKVEEARVGIAELIGAAPEEIYFTSGGTESDNWAVSEAVRRRGHIITSAVEHKAVLVPVQNYMNNGGRADIIPVTQEGIVRMDVLRRKIRQNTVLISVMMANNEIGTIEPIQQIGNIAREYDVIFHTDAVQAMGHIPVNVKYMGVDMLSASSHKFNGPKGVGFLYIRKGTGIEPFIRGGGQERGMRSGTENVPGIIGMAAAAKASCEKMEYSSEKCRYICKYMTERIIREIPDCRINGPADRNMRLPGNMSFSFKNVDAQSLIVLLDMQGITASAGSACNTGSPSHVIKAIGTDRDYAMGTLRFSIDSSVTIQQADYVVMMLKRAVFRLRGV